MESWLAFILVMVYVCSTAGYSLLIKLSGNRLVLFGAVNGLTMLIAIPLLFVVPLPPFSVWPYILGSVVAYNAMLYFAAKAYTHADLSVVFPVRKAVSFVAVVLGAKFIMGEGAMWYEWASFAVIFVGILLQISWRKANKIDQLMPFVFMFFMGLFSAAQSIFDFMGIRESEAPYGYIVVLMFIGLPSTILAFVRHGHEIKTVLMAQKQQIITASLLDNVGYACFLYAIYVARALYAVPLSNLAVVLATVIGLFHLKESMRLRRLLSAVLIAGAIAAVHVLNALGGAS